MVENSVLLPAAHVAKGVHVSYALVGPKTDITEDQIGTEKEVILVDMDKMEE